MTLRIKEVVVARFGDYITDEMVVKSCGSKVQFGTGSILKEN